MKVQTTENSEPKKLTDICETIRTASTEKLKVGDHNDLVKNAILLASQENSYRAVQQIALALFASRKYRLSQHHRLLEVVLIAAAREATASELSNNDLNLSQEALIAVLQNAWQEWKKGYKLDDKTYEAQPQPYNGILCDENPEKLITITHAGGLSHIQLFLKGKSKGYALDHYKGKFPGYGITVCPGKHNKMKARAYAYAIRAASKCCDVPAVMTAQIQVKYLVATPNSSYECGLRKEHVDKLQNIEVKEYSYDEFKLQDCVGEIEYIFDETLEAYNDKFQEELEAVRQFALPPLNPSNFTI